VELRDGGSINSSQLEKFCESTHPVGVLSSTGQNMLIRFRTDGSVTHAGFKASVTFGQLLHLHVAKV